jgi:preprotein translocase subunit SecB
MKESNFQFANPIFNEIYLYINDDFNNEDFNGLDINSNTTVNMSKEESNAIVSLEINIGGKDNRYPFVIKCKLSSDFRWSEEAENIDELLQKNAPALLLSYARPYISMLTASTRYPAFNLPFMSFQDNKQE